MIAETPQQCAEWTGRAVVCDVLRCSTNICAMLKRGKPHVRVFADKDKAVAWHAGNPGGDFFSELDFPPEFEKYDNSPSQALQSDPRRPAVLVTGAGTKAILSLRNAEAVYIGCFANFPAAAAKIRAGGDFLLVPAGIFYLNHPEDLLCARALEAAASGGENAAQNALALLKESGRLEKFLRERPQNGAADLAIALNTGGLNLLPEVKISGDCAVAKL
ncbi:MAG: 2-phosphosulfolactate phosphatase [Elusimicrobiales bacterium]